VLRLAAASARILGVAEGDGTISAAAAVALETGLPLLVIPAGTFNHFAADLGVESARDALAALRDGEVATAESRFVHGKHPHALVVYRKADASQTGDVAARRAAQSGDRPRRRANR
jgi:diacylglycerol kinase family enzyme